MRKSRILATAKLKSFQPLIDKLSANQNVQPEDLHFLAANPSTRHALFGILKKFARTELFPSLYFTREKAAESFLVTWLEFPTELNRAPEKIQLFTTVTLREEKETIEYYVFKYQKQRVMAAKDGTWMLGVAGPYYHHSEPYDVPLRIYSRFNEVGTVSAWEEARWVHHRIAKK
jgi:hypothetical protein